MMFLKDLTAPELQKVIDQADPLQDYPNWGIVTFFVYSQTHRPHVHYMILDQAKRPIAFHCSNSDVALCLSSANSIQKQIAINSIQKQVQKLTHQI